jgi:vesicle coat complex subunit
MAGATSEQELVVLCHVRLLLERCVEAFADDYRRFFCRQNDPIYLKMVKIDVLQEVATAHSAPEISTSQLRSKSEYV